ncbi:MAG: hypothetical protein K9J24_11640 [Bacteroidales bacterium]|nr:hypothetical protein [Bacteroidales bacterium]
MKSIQNIILIIMLLFSAGVKAQNIDPDLQNKIYPLLENNGEPVLAASEYAAPYAAGIGLNLMEHPLKNGSFRNPEFLVLYHFLFMREGNLGELEQLYDPETQEELGNIIDIDQAAEAYADFKNFELLSKALFGEYVRLRYNFINQEDQPIPWVLIARQIEGRWYLTESLPIEHLFIDVSSVNPYNYSREEFENLNVAGLNQVFFEASGLEFIRVPDNDPGSLGIYYRIEKQTTGKPARELLYDMVESLRDTSNARFIDLWDGRNRQKLRSSKFYTYQIEVQRDFY